MIKINNQDLLIKRKILVNYNKEKNIFKKKEKVLKVDKDHNQKKKLIIHRLNPLQNKIKGVKKLLNSLQIKNQTIFKIKFN